VRESDKLVGSEDPEVTGAMALEQFSLLSLGETGPVAVNAWQVLKMKVQPPAA
jgi:hypothetical protein